MPVKNLVVCSKCDYSGQRCFGPCPCTVDSVDIATHAERGYCPHPDGAKFGDGEKPDGWEDLAKALPVQPIPQDWKPGDYALDSGGSEGCNC